MLRTGFAGAAWVLHHAGGEGHNPSSCGLILTAQLHLLIRLRRHVASAVWFVGVRCDPRREISQFAQPATFDPVHLKTQPRWAIRRQTRYFCDLLEPINLLLTVPPL